MLELVIFYCNMNSCIMIILHYVTGDSFNSFLINFLTNPALLLKLSSYRKLNIL